MGDDITIGVTEIVNNIEVTAQPSDQVIDIDVVDNSDDVTLNITPTVIEININKGSSFARWGTILGNLPDQEDLQNVLNLKADLVGGLVPASQLPSYVDDIVEVANYAALPVVGETGKIYLTLDNNKIFRWSGSVYIEVAANNAIWGAITGTLSSQTDLQTALDTKALKTITITPNAPLSGGGDLSANRTISISQSNATTDGYLSSTDWTTFNSKQGALNGTGFVKISGTTISYDNSTYVPTSRTITINGTSYDLSANRSWTIPTHDAVTIGTANGLSLVGQSLSLGLASSINTGALSAENWATFNSKIGGSGNLNYIPKFTSSSTIGNSLLYDNGTNVFVGGSGSNDYRFNVVEGATLNGQQILMQNVSSSKEALHIVHIGTGNLIKGTKASAVEVFNVTNSGGAYFAGSVGIGTTSPAVKLQVQDSANTFVSHFSGLNQTNGIAIGTNSSNVAVIQGYTRTFSATNNIAINADGGSVGIGTTSPSALLDLQHATLPQIDFHTGANKRADIRATSDALFLNSITGNSIQLQTDGTTKVLITSSGNVGIGTTSPYAKLQVFSDRYNDSLTFNAAAGFIIGGSIRQLSINTDDTSPYGIGFQGKTNGNSAANIYFQSLGGNVGIGTTSPSYTLHVNGSVAGTSAYVNLSDKRHKKDILPIENALDKILALNGVTFNWDKESTDMNLDDNNHIGLIAQDVEKIIPQAVVTAQDENKTKSVAYTDLVPMLIEAIKELKAEIEILKNK